MNPTDSRFFRLWRRVRERIIVPVITLHLLYTGPLWGQRLVSSVGPVLELELPYVPSGLVALRTGKGAQAEIALLQTEPGRLHFYRMAREGELITTRMIALDAPAAPVLLAADLNRDGKDDLVTLSPDPPVLVLLTRNAEGFKSATVPVPAATDGCAAADINNDGRVDLLLFGKTVSGVQTVLGQAGGGFREGPLLFPDISVRDLAAADLNADGITDILLADWLSDRLITFYGIGRGVFSEQVTTQLEGEPDHIALTPLTRDRRFGVAVSLTVNSTVQILEGDATGALRLVETLPVPDAPGAVSFTRLKGGRFPDLTVTGRSSVSVSAGVALHTFSAPVPSGVGAELLPAVAGDVDGDRLDDLICADRQSRRLVVLGNALSTAPGWPATASVGIDPRGIAVADVTGDGVPDLLVANAGSAHLSLLRGRTNGRFEAQEAIPVPPRPMRVLAVGGAGTWGHTLIATHEDRDNVTILRYDPDSSRTSSTAVPTGSRPHVVLARPDSAGGTIQMLVRYEHGRDRSLSLSLFEQTGAHQFIERSLRPNLPGRVLALTVDDVVGDGRYDLLYVTRERPEGTCAVSLARATSGFDFSAARRVTAFVDSEGAAQTLLTGFVDRDASRDLLLVFGPPRNAIGILCGRGGGAFRDSLEWIRDVHPVGEDLFLLRDLDGNGSPDLLFLDDRRGAAVAVYQRSAGGFDPPVSVCSARGATGIAVAPLRNPGEMDLVLSWGQKGIVSVTFDPFAR